MTAATLLTPLKSAGYALAVPPRTGNWQIDPGVSYLELRLRELHRTSLLEAPIIHGQAHLTDTASTSWIQLQFGAAYGRRGSSRATAWMRSAGLDSRERPARYDSRMLLASPRGWRMCGQLHGESLDAMLIADAHVLNVLTRSDGRDAMVMTAYGCINRTRSGDLSQALVRSRVAVRIHAYLVHD